MALARSEFEQLYRAHAPAVFRRARGLLRSEADAHEVVQELFLALYERPALLDEKRALTGYLYTAATHACLNRLRNHNTRTRLLREQTDFAVGTTGPHAETLSILRTVLARMPEPLGQLAVYYYFDELTHEEIAPLLGCSRRQVGHLLERLAVWREREETHEHTL